MMGRSNSRVAEEAREARQRLRDLEKQIADLDRKIADPVKYAEKNPLPDSELGSARSPRTKSRSTRPVRKPIRSEMRRHRNQAILWALAAFFVLIWSLGKLIKIFGR